MQILMSVLPVSVLTTVTTMETVEGSTAPVMLDIHWTLMDTPVLVCNFIMRYHLILTMLYKKYIDVNECSTSNGGCTETCTNTAGSYYCTCPSGYSLASNAHGCNGEHNYRK